MSGIKKLYGILSAFDIWTYVTRTLTDVANIWAYATRRLTDAQGIFGKGLARTAVPAGTALYFDVTRFINIAISIGQSLLVDVQITGDNINWDTMFDFGPLGGGTPSQSVHSFFVLAGAYTRLRNNTINPLNVAIQYISITGL